LIQNDLLFHNYSEGVKPNPENTEPYSKFLTSKDEDNPV